MKGVSAIIATVLLVAFTVAVAGILSIWAASLTNPTPQIQPQQIQPTPQYLVDMNCSQLKDQLINLKDCGFSSLGGSAAAVSSGCNTYLIYITNLMILKGCKI